MPIYPHCLRLSNQPLLCGGTRTSGAPDLEQLDSDHALQLHFYARGCDADDPWACYELAVLHDLGLGVERDDRLSAELHGMACEAGVPRSDEHPIHDRQRAWCPRPRGLLFRPRDSHAAELIGWHSGSTCVETPLDRQIVRQRPVAKSAMNR